MPKRVSVAAAFRPATLVLALVLALCLAACQSLTVASLTVARDGQRVDIAGTPLDLYTYRPKDCRPRLVMIVFDGQYRHAWAARDQARSLANRFCGFIVAPQFDAFAYPRDYYEFGGVNVKPPGHRTIDLVAPLATWGRRAVDAPDLPFVVLGHSSGGQIVSRFAAFASTGAAGIIVANPSTWVLPSTTVASPFGLGGTEVATEDGLRAYLARPVTVLLGTADTGMAELATTTAANAQGLDRYTRGLRTFRMAQDVARTNGWPFGWTLAEVPGVGHSPSAMYRSPQAAEAVERALSTPPTK